MSSVNTSGEYYYNFLPISKALIDNSHKTLESEVTGHLGTPQLTPLIVAYLGRHELHYLHWQPALAMEKLFKSLPPFQAPLTQPCPLTQRSFREMALEHLTDLPPRPYNVLLVRDRAHNTVILDAKIGLAALQSRRAIPGIASPLLSIAAFTIRCPRFLTLSAAHDVETNGSLTAPLPAAVVAQLNSFYSELADSVLLQSDVPEHAQAVRMTRIQDAHIKKAARLQHINLYLTHDPINKPCLALLEQFTCDVGDLLEAEQKEAICKLVAQFEPELGHHYTVQWMWANIFLDSRNKRPHLCDYKKAVEHYQKAITLSQNGKVDAPYLTHGAELQSNLAEALKHMREIDKAVEAYEQALTHNPQKVALHFELADLFCAQKKFDLAESALAKGLTDEETAAGYYVRIKSVVSHFLRAGLLTKAEKYARILIRLKRDARDAMTLLGKVHMAQKNYKEAEKCFKEAREEAK